ncbi:MAG: dihydrofolate reductase family protein [Chloroflexi bacterium]|nr:dihydrofolate reductase family protein [Chloroflexota bacterium]MCI0575358.1 dihydrofolate reductase family protein [Chloroflexota bacterium]MCI0646394.1 dihydrofolate reductase family protein [Chloroflexota bacterium]MCI0728348.1 dihydrofolate reductase family protein [Chloroflexota bacterium]
MGKVIFHNSVSLDGFVAGPNDGPGNPLGDGGEALFRWYFSGDTEVQLPGSPALKMSKRSAEVFLEGIRTIGAMVVGRRMFDIAGAWGGTPPGEPCFVVTHTAPQEWVKEGSPFIFVTDGVESAIEQAKAAAGDNSVAVSSANIAQQCIRAGLLDEIHLAVTPVLLGGGVRLFEQLGDKPIELEQLAAIEGDGVTHLAYRVIK